jgi:ankyrin repeat protein
MSIELSGQNKRMLRKRKRVNVQDIFGYTPLIYSIWTGNLDFAHMLVKLGADPNLANFTSSWTPLFYAVIKMQMKDSIDDKNFTDFVRYLLKSGADPNAEDSDGWTALFYCRNHPRLAMELIRRGADLNALRDYPSLGSIFQHTGCTALASYRESVIFDTLKKFLPAEIIALIIEWHYCPGVARRPNTFPIKHHCVRKYLNAWETVMKERPPSIYIH